MLEDLDRYSCYDEMMYMRCWREDDAAIRLWEAERYDEVHLVGMAKGDFDDEPYQFLPTQGTTIRICRKRCRTTPPPKGGRRFDGRA